MKIIKTLFQLLIFSVLLLSVFILISSKTSVFGGIRSFIVVSGSMQPEIYKGSVVFSRVQKAYRPGEIISFSNNSGQTVTHRIIDKISIKEGNFYQVKGDANNTPDGDFVEENKIIGRVFIAIPYIGNFVRILKTPPGFIGLIMVPSAIFIIWELWQIRKEFELQIEKKILKKYHKVSFT